jgi:hypothetical protein
MVSTAMNIFRSLARQWFSSNLEPRALAQRATVTQSPVPAVQRLGQFVDGFDAAPERSNSARNTPIRFSFRDGFEASFRPGTLSRDAFTAGGRPLVDLSGGVKPPVPQVEQTPALPVAPPDNGFLASVDDFV